MAVPPQRIADDGYTGHVIVRLAQALAASRGTTLEEVLRDADRLRLIDVLSQYGSPPSRRLVESVPLEVLLEMDETAARSSQPPIFRMASFWRVDFRENFAAAREFVAGALEAPEVENAYLEGTVQPAGLAPDPTGNPEYRNQGHLRAAPEGINAPAAWQHTGGDGAGIGVVDLEGDWNFNHQDIVGRGATCHVGTRTGSANDKNHGTAVLGTILAMNNGMGGIGVAPGVSKVSTVCWNFPPNTMSDVPAAMVFALHNLMAPRDILVLEAETRSVPARGWPVEIRDGEFAATQLLVAHDRIVIAAAGNGPQDPFGPPHYDLDTDVPGGYPAGAFDRAFRDSGAILVGSCSPGAAPNFSQVPHPQSNRGTRIDCYAWGEGVLTSHCDNGLTNTCYGNFNGTSAATAIIAGAALCVQGVAQAGTGRLSPGQMRALLSDPMTGTKSAAPVADKIGVMPDLGRVISQAALVPDVYVRDSLTDDGTVPSPLLQIGHSPDIIVSGTQLADAAAQAKWGEGSGYETRDDFGALVTAGYDAWVHVRLKNRSANLARQATATVFWAEPATLLTPDQWKPIGTTAPIDVAPGDTLFVSPGVLWTKANRPAGSEHFCLIALAGSALDPAPVQPPPNDWPAFVAFMRFGNNVAWRNINVLHLHNSPLARWVETTPFYLTGAQELHLEFDFEIVQRLPAGVRAHLRVPTGFAGLCKQAALEAHADEKDKKAERTVLTLPALRRVPVRSVVMPAGRRFRAELLLEIDGGVELSGHSVTIRQLWRGVEVGSITWRFMPPPGRVPDDDDDE